MIDVRSRQRARALALANASRQRKAHLKRMLKSGELRLDEALDHPDLADWPIGDVVGFCCIGESRWKGNTQPLPAPQLALDLLEHAKVGFRRPVRDITALERQLLLNRAEQLNTRRLRRRIARCS